MELSSYFLEYGIKGALQFIVIAILVIAILLIQIRNMESRIMVLLTLTTYTIIVFTYLIGLIVFLIMMIKVACNPKSGKDSEKFIKKITFIMSPLYFPIYLYLAIVLKINYHTCNRKMSLLVTFFITFVIISLFKFTELFDSIVYSSNPNDIAQMVKEDLHFHIFSWLLSITLSCIIQGLFIFYNTSFILNRREYKSGDSFVAFCHYHTDLYYRFWRDMCCPLKKEI